ncbi:MAG: dihydroneopterin aldolase [Chitinophagaceae bacterium]|nr:dihydroneopterin aldolase [Chitinophagaceae bacterium]
MVSIELQNLRFHAFHGLYEGEARTGSPYEVSLRISYDEGKSVFADINDTINYAEIFAIVKQRMMVPTPLLEKLADGIIRRIKHQYPRTREISLTIFKLHAPIENLEGRVGVTLTKQFD